MELHEKCKNIQKSLEMASRRQSYSETFRDVIDLIVMIIGANTTANIGETGEDIFNRLTKKYSEDEIRELFRIGEDICQAVKETKKDVLGRLYMLSNHNKSLGQFFTPDHVSEMMAKMASSTENETYSDPCCGSGSLMLGVLRTLESEGKDYQLPIFYLNDIDLLCCKMIFIQFSVLGATALITCSNALLEDPFRSDYDGMWLKTPLYHQREMLTEFLNNIESDKPNEKAS